MVEEENTKKLHDVYYSYVFIFNICINIIFIKDMYENLNNNKK